MVSVILFHTWISCRNGNGGCMYHLIVTLFNDDDEIIKHQDLPFEKVEKAMEYFRLNVSLYEMVIGR
jgi:hypothetical protein